MTLPEMALDALPPDWMTSIPARQVYGALERAGGDPRFIGGCVRDALLGCKIRDIDIATALEPKQVIAAAEAAGLATTLPGWASLLIVCGQLVLIGAILGVVGVKMLQKGAQPIPEQALEEAQLATEALRDGE